MTNAGFARVGSMLLAWLLVAAVVVGSPEAASSLEGTVISTEGFPVRVLQAGTGSATGVNSGGVIVGSTRVDGGATTATRWATEASGGVQLDLDWAVTTAVDIGDDGTIVGAYRSQPGSPYTFPYSWTSSGGAVPTPLPTDYRGNSSVDVEAVDGTGLQVGDYVADGGVAGWTFEPGQTRANNIGTPPWGSSAFPLDVDAGRIVGVAESRPFLLAEDAGSWTELATPNTNGAARAIGDAFAAGNVEAADGSNQAVVWSLGETPTIIATIPDLGGGATVPRAIASIGGAPHVVGVYYRVDGSTATRAFHWSEATGAIDLGTLGGSTAAANDVNGAGQIVGYAQMVDRTSKPVVWAVADLGGPATLTASILAPEAGVVFADNDPPLFFGTAADPEDGNLTGDSLEWSSNVDGFLGFGQSITPSLSVGSHTITLTATDSDGQSVTDAITVTVVDPATQGPTVSISSPDDGGEYSGEASISFVPSASDPQDGINALSYEWTSSLDGVFSTSRTAFTSLSLGTHVVTVTVTDTDGNVAEDSVTIDVVDPATQGPTVSITGPDDGASFDAGTRILFSSSASDPQDESFQLDYRWTSSIDGPFGTSQSAATDALSPGVHDITITVTDNDGNSASESISITIVGDNDPPVLDPVGDQTVDEETELRVTLSADDADGDTVTFSLEGDVPAGAVTSGTDLVWTPTEAQGPGDYTFDVVASDGVVEDRETITVSVAEVNIAPTVDPIPDQSTTVGTEVIFTATASDPDLPANTITWSLGPEAPTGATIDSTSGAFAWTPEAGDVGTATFDVIADDGTGAANATGSATVSITVAEAVETVVIEITEGVGVRDVVEVRPPVEITISEGVGVRDDMVVEPSVFIRITEGVGVRDEVAVNPPVEIVISEGIGVADDVTIQLPVEIVITEGVGVRDDVTFTTVEEGTVSSGTLLPDGSYDFSGSGFDPGSDINIGLESEFIPLTTAVADENGEFSVTVTLPPADELPEGFAGEHALVAKGINPEGVPHEVRAAVVVAAPVTVDLHPSNPTDATVGDDPVTFIAEVSFTADRLTDETPDLSDFIIRLEPVGPGEIVEADECHPASGAVGDLATVTCEFEDVPVNTYTVVAEFAGEVFYGRDEAVFTLGDPSLGFVTGGGWVPWPDTGDMTEFGLDARYRPRTTPKGSFELVRSLADGAEAVLESTAIHGLAIGTPGGWATFSGMASYQGPGMAEPAGDHTFVAYLVDDAAGDRLWLEVRRPDGTVVEELTVPAPAEANAVTLGGGNVVLHQPARGGPKQR